ncbi:MAG: hypothetical protein AB4352_10225 [Hormoscilla sp.]
MSERREFVQVIWGILILLGLNVLSVGICLAIASLGVQVLLIYIAAIGISQLLYVVPLCIWLKRKNRMSMMKGVIIGAVITALLNGGCYLLLLSMAG